MVVVLKTGHLESIRHMEVLGHIDRFGRFLDSHDFERILKIVILLKGRLDSGCCRFGLKGMDNVLQGGLVHNHSRLI